MAPLTPLVVLHGAVSTTWLALYFVQTTLVAAGRTDIHRRIGIAGALLAPLVIGVGYATAIAAARRGFDLSGVLHMTPENALKGLVFPLFDLVTFGVFVASALWFRRRLDIHKRLMLLAVFGGLMPAPLAHLTGSIGAPGLIVPLVAAFFFTSAIHDRLTERGIHRISLWGGIGLFLWGNLRAFVIGPSGAWHAFAAWLVG